MYIISHDVRKKVIVYRQAEANKIPRFHNGIYFRMYHFHSFCVCLFECPVYGVYFMMVSCLACLGGS